jgi:phosphate transport system permease protein
MSEPSANAALSAERMSATGKYLHWRLFKDRLARYGVVAGGLGVIVAIVMILFYLFFVVLPLFHSAEMTQVGDYSLPGKETGKTVFLTGEEQNEIAVRLTDNGAMVFFELATGNPLVTQTVKVPEDVRITGFAQGNPLAQGGFAYGLSDGKAIIGKLKYSVTYIGNKRTITPTVEYPFGEAPIPVAAGGTALEKMTLRFNDEEATIAAIAGQKTIIVSLSKEQALFAEQATVTRSESSIETGNDKISEMLIDKDNRLIYLLAANGSLNVYDIGNQAEPKLKFHVNAAGPDQNITAMTFLNGDLSLLLGDSSGQISQWAQVKDNDQPVLQKIRTFKLASKAAVIAIVSEQRRKGFAGLAADGTVGLFNSTAERTLITTKIDGSPPQQVMLTPRSNRLLLEMADGKMLAWQLNNEHPEASIKSLWRKVWYESYPKPAYIWQSSSASNDFEPKYSLTPLVFGTLKAAFYAMMFALPLALMGAIYTAYFMAAPVRQVVKPTIELMGALPTVIVGFLAGLWLAPFIEKHLAGLFLTLLALPLSVLALAFAWQFIPAKYRQLIPENWESLLLIPSLILVSWLAFTISGMLEAWLFNGSLRDWFNTALGIGYDQRNALVVGIAMGFAVIPTIFSIAEDAIFSVPKHLTVGSLALGATPWQTLSRVVLLTASPGIFSAVMIGFGRAIGETMIVLMATGNTPVMDFSIFQGLRTLAANVAVEMPESEVDSTHYRILFLAALVLFLTTFIFNTLAEVIRQRLREKYSSL